MVEDCQLTSPADFSFSLSWPN